MSTELTTPESKQAQNEVATVERTRGGLTYSPRIDIWETDDELMLYADMPGVSAENLDIHFENRELRIHGNVCPRHEGINFLYGEYGIGDFHRTFTIGESIATKKQLYVVGVGASAGGLVIAQSEESAKFDGMPRAAIETGVVDLVLPPDKMADALCQFVTGGALADSAAPDEATAANGDAMNAIFKLLRLEYGIDFSWYKKTQSAAASNAACRCSARTIWTSTSSSFARTPAS